MDRLKLFPVITSDQSFVCKINEKPPENPRPAMPLRNAVPYHTMPAAARALVSGALDRSSVYGLAGLAHSPSSTHPRLPANCKEVSSLAHANNNPTESATPPTTEHSRHNTHHHQHSQHSPQSSDNQHPLPSSTPDTSNIHSHRALLTQSTPTTIKHSRPSNIHHHRHNQHSPPSGTHKKQSLPLNEIVGLGWAALKSSDGRR
jgi:hypothetical protein